MIPVTLHIPKINIYIAIIFAIIIILLVVYGNSIVKLISGFTVIVPITPVCDSKPTQTTPTISQLPEEPVPTVFVLQETEPVPTIKIDTPSSPESCSIGLNIDPPAPPVIVELQKITANIPTTPSTQEILKNNEGIGRILNEHKAVEVEIITKELILMNNITLGHSNLKPTQIQTVANNILAHINNISPIIAQYINRYYSNSNKLAEQNNPISQIAPQLPTQPITIPEISIATIEQYRLKPISPDNGEKNKEYSRQMGQLGIFYMSSDDCIKLLTRYIG